MNKNRFPGQSFSVATWLTVFFLLAIQATMLSTRAGLSISMVLFGGLALIGHSPRRWLSNRWWIAGVAWVALYGLSYFWSDDKAHWGEVFSVKLPILLLPLAFGFLPRLSNEQLRVLIVGVLVFLLSGIAYSMAQFLVDPKAAIEGYGVSHVMRTPLFNSHIQFSVAVASAVVLIPACWRLFKNGFERVVLGLVLLMFVAYLHLLAAKTGLLMLYVFACLLVFRSAFKDSILKALLFLLVCCAAFWAAVTYVPTLNKRVGYVAYSWQEMLKGTRDGTYSDIGRILSWHVAANVIARHPLTGAGAGDILHVMREEYRSVYPAVAPENHLVPHNQVLCAGVVGGVPAIILFLIWLVIPFVEWGRKRREGFYFRALWLILLIPLFVEPFLEVQGGVAVYLYFLLLGQYLLRHLLAPSGEEAAEGMNGGTSHDQFHPDFSSQGGGLPGRGT